MYIYSSLGYLLLADMLLIFKKLGYFSALCDL